jgi:hypothetical protein
LLKEIRGYRFANSILGEGIECAAQCASVLINLPLNFITPKTDAVPPQSGGSSGSQSSIKAMRRAMMLI